jgi:RNA polymerase sigma-70 factor (ECF subfamily)
MSRSENKEERLVSLAQSGDEGAWRDLVEEHAPALRRRIQRRLPARVRRRVSESDVLQEAWLVASRRLQELEYRGARPFRAWLNQIADNATRGLVNHHVGTERRNAFAEVTRGLRGQTDHHADRNATPSAEALGHETRERIAEAMSRLPPDYRTIIELLQHRRTTIAEAAELMGRSTNAVKKLHGRALAAFVSILDSEEGSSHGAK